MLDSRMPRIANTPESFLPRSDSRNPATTCRGITTQGRPCRRALAASKHSTLISTHWGKDAKHEIPDQTALYCWQHKEQATPSTPQYEPVKPRTSIDTLMDRLGVLDIKDEQSALQKARQRRRDTQRNVNEKRRPRPKATFCCFEVVDDDSDKDERPVKPTTRPVSSQSTPKLSHQPQPTLVPGQRVPSRPSTLTTRKSSSSQTQSLMSWIPSTLSPQTTSLLLAELAKPISSADEEGYVYMFWLTPQSATTGTNAHQPLPRDIASSLVPSTATVPQTETNKTHLRPAPQTRSISDAIRAARDLNALTSNPTPTTPGTVRLKIGRTGNVHRRLTEWTRQCSHDLTLIRYYPYTPSSPARTPPARRERSHSWSTGSESHAFPGRKVRHVHRVERLIHLELAGLRVRDLGRCCECGQEHREWFEVEAAKDALRRVDECVRRWVSWGESIG